MAVETATTKYIYLDIVRFTYNRSVEAQSELVQSLNGIVKDVIASQSVKAEQLILLPTGDGICISLLNLNEPFDVHVKMGLQILAKVEAHNSAVTDTQRRFQLRIGLNENLDNVVVDINGRRNLAGAGINFAQRVMSFADGGQILVGQAVYEVLRHREDYMNSFREYAGRTKHGTLIRLFQFIEVDSLGLNVEIPSMFRETISKAPALTKHVAYYIAHAYKYVHFFQAIHKTNATAAYSSIVLLWLLGEDAKELSELKPHQNYDRHTELLPRGIEKQYWAYSRSDYVFVFRLS